MTETSSATIKRNPVLSRQLIASIPLVLGILCTLGWAALMAGLFAGMDITESGVALTVALLVVTALTALSTFVARSKGAVVAVVFALLYAAVWAYFRYAFDTTMPDGLLYLLTAVFFLSPLATAITAVIVGIRARRAVARASAKPVAATKVAEEPAA